MKYLAVDIETTGLDENYCQILEIAIVLADTLDFTTPIEELLTYHCRLYYDKIIGDPIGLAMNADLLRDMHKRPNTYNYLHPDSVSSDFSNWLRKLGLQDERFSFSGKNYGTFDSRFLWKLARWNREKFQARVLDPAVLFFLPEDDKLPDLKTCISRAGIVWDESRHHQAIEDARMVVMLNRIGLQRVWQGQFIPTYDPFPPAVGICSGQKMSVASNIPVKARDRLKLVSRVNNIVTLANDSEISDGIVDPTILTEIPEGKPFWMVSLF